MSRRAVAPVATNRAALFFAGGVAVLSLAWFFGIATRVSLAQDNDVVARAGISRVLTGGFPDFRDTTFVVLLAVGGYLRLPLGAVAGLPPRLRRRDRRARCCQRGDAARDAAYVPGRGPPGGRRAHVLDRRQVARRIQPSAPGTVDDPVANEVRVFRNAPSGYGPLAYAIGGAPIPFVGDGFKANLLGQKVMGGIFLTLTAPPRGSSRGGWARTGAFVAGIVGLNPMMLWQFRATATTTR